VVDATFEALVEEAERAPIEGWDFSWLAGRAIEERPTWRYFDRVVERASGVSALLEVQAGVGGMIGNLPHLPPVSVATEGFAPSVAVAGPQLRDRGAHLVVTSQTPSGLPFAADTFELVISRHPVDVWWTEITRVLRPGGTYFAQHVGPNSLRNLSEFLMGRLPAGSKRDPDVERSAAEAAGMAVRGLHVEHPRTVFYDVGAVVYFLRLVPWIVPGFAATKYKDRLRELHEVMQRDGGFETAASRMLVEATKPSSIPRPTTPAQHPRPATQWRLAVQR
jgi:SAM-dependent methyltransferase